MSDPTTPPCTSMSNCLVAIHTGAGVDLHSSRRTDQWLTVDTDEWEAHLADVRAAALTEAADYLAERLTEAPPIEHRSGMRYAVGRLRRLAEAYIGVPPAPPSATLPADDAPPVSEQAPEPQGPAEDPAGCRCGCGHPTPAPEADATLDRLTAELDHWRRLTEAADARHDTARTAAETFRDELARAGEQLLTVTAERDRLAEILRGAVLRADAEVARMRPVVDAAREMVQHPANRGVLGRLEDAVDAYGEDTP